MNRSDVVIHIIPSGIDIRNLLTYDENRNGKIFSDSKEIRVNKNSGKYSILYTTDMLKTLNTEIFGKNMIDLFLKNLPNTILDVTIIYHYKLKDDDEEFDTKVAEVIFQLEKYFREMNNKITHLSYHRTNLFLELINTYNEYMSDIDEEDEEEDDSYDNWINKLIGDVENEDDEDDNDEDVGDILSLLAGRHNKSKNNNSRDYYGKSKVMKNATNPKRSINRHGVIVADDKEDIERDERILKEFLKDFFPGNQGWKKDFRHDVLKRWISMYCVSKKNLKKLERNHRRERLNYSRKYDTEKALNFTRRMLTVPIDRWSDPNR